MIDMMKEMEFTMDNRIRFDFWENQSHTSTGDLVQYMPWI